MRVALFPSAFHPHFGGVEELARQLGQQLKRFGHEPFVFSNRWPKHLSAFEEFEGLRIRRWVFRVPEWEWRQMLTSWLFTKTTLHQVSSALIAERAEVIHVQCVSSNSYYAVRARRRLKIPLVVTLQGELTMDANGLFQKSQFARGLMRTALEEADVITACSRKTLEDAEDFYGRSLGDRARVIFNAASGGDFETAEPYEHPRPYIFALGRIVPQKGFDVLISAFSKSEIINYDLLIAGDGTERAALEELTARLGLRNRVHFIGRADRRKVAALFRGASFFVLPSRSDEGLPVVCSEAMAAGKAILATRSGGVPEAVLHDETGIIVEREDVDGLANGLSKLAKDHGLRERFARAGKARSSEFSWPAVTQQYLESYWDAKSRLKQCMGQSTENRLNMGMPKPHEVDATQR